MSALPKRLWRRNSSYGYATYFLLSNENSTIYKIFVSTFILILFNWQTSKVIKTSNRWIGVRHHSSRFFSTSIEIYDNVYLKKKNTRQLRSRDKVCSRIKEKNYFWKCCSSLMHLWYRVQTSNKFIPRCITIFQIIFSY